jgi:ribulose-5-phosphate 4-epimerase/fuculose-1-phosphate aldolase
MQRAANVSRLDQAGEFAAAERQARIDLAAAHRLADIRGYNEGIFNHFTLVAPGRSDRFLVIPFGLHWSEVTASVFLEVSFDGQVMRGTGEVERSAYCIHAPIHCLGPHAACVLHTHMPFASAFTRLENGRLAPTGQTEAGLAGMSAYDDSYTGLAFDPAEGARLGKVLGDKKILFMANHGVIVVGSTVAEAFDRLYYLERACQVQLYAMWTGRPLKLLPEAVVKRTFEQFETAPKYAGGRLPCDIHFDALKRTLDRTDTSYQS